MQRVGRQLGRDLLMRNCERMHSQMVRIFMRHAQPQAPSPRQDKRRNGQL